MSRGLTQDVVTYRICNKTIGEPAILGHCKDGEFSIYLHFASKIGLFTILPRHHVHNPDRKSLYRIAQDGYKIGLVNGNLWLLGNFRSYRRPSSVRA